MRAAAYRSFLDQLASLLEGGIPILEALALLSKGPSRPIARAAGMLERRIRDGDTVAEAMAGDPQDFPPPHRAVLKAAEKGGLLPEALRRLRDEVDRHIAIRRSLWTRSAYPLLLLVAAAVLLPTVLLAQGRIGAYFLFEALVFGLAGGTAWLCFRWKRQALTLLSGMPFLRGVGESLSLLGLLLEAGIGVREALGLSAAAARSPLLQGELEEAARALEKGSNLTQSLEKVSGIPPIERGEIQSGEHAGSMDRALRRAGRAIEEDAQRRLERVLSVLPFAVYFIAAGVVGTYYVLVMLRHFSAITG